MKHSADVLIIGGGIIGLTTAYFLTREGVRVAVLDQRDLGQEASWAGAGILPPGNPAAAQSPFDRFRAHSVTLFPALSMALRERTGIDNGYLQCGGVELLAQHATASEEEWRGAGVRAEEYADGRTLEPELAAGLGPVCYLPDLAQVRNPRHLKALCAACELLGVQLVPHTPVQSFERTGNRISGAQAGGTLWSADRYILAAGAWTSALLQPLGWNPAIKPIRGQIALLHPGRFLLQRVLMSGPRYLVPRPDGRILIGSTEEDVGFDKENTAGGIAGLLALAVALIPALASAPLERCWAGLRPGSPDGNPWIGLVPGLDNLWIAAGHFRAGVQLSPGTALALKEQVLGLPPTLDVAAFRPRG